ncbi:hypothetical protein FGO68_gene10828 [Halteria grandinella]|uniref:Uncharacterized protein n=1 Tax=Halteria grandinella TaxID=5974 RepID=A0A8J8N9M9_HALGN|nr:hypothetical protein FGO68_gene10828 [Halteria grandinella]
MLLYSIYVTIFFALCLATSLEFNAIAFSVLFIIIRYYFPCKIVRNLQLGPNFQTLFYILRNNYIRNIYFFMFFATNLLQLSIISQILGANTLTNQITLNHDFYTYSLQRMSRYISSYLRCICLAISCTYIYAILFKFYSVFIDINFYLTSTRLVWDVWGIRRDICEFLFNSTQFYQFAQRSLLLNMISSTCISKSGGNSCTDFSLRSLCTLFVAGLPNSTRIATYNS